MNKRQLIDDIRRFRNALAERTKAPHPITDVCADVEAERAFVHELRIEPAHAAAAKRFSTLKKARGHTVAWSAPPLTLPDREPILVHVIDGQHFASFDASSQRAFLDTVWQVAPESNRMGFRLSGPPLGRPQADEILSGPTCLGSVQVPPIRSYFWRLRARS